MIIIIEGPDRVGKDTLIKSLKNRFYRENFIELHYSGVKPYDGGMSVKDVSVEINKNMFKILNTDFNFIVNRSHIGEMVYSPKYRGYSGDYVLELEKSLKRSDVFLILLSDDPVTLAARDDGNNISNLVSDISDEIDAFRIALRKSSIKNKIEIKCNSKTPSEIASEAIKFIESAGK